MCNCLQYRNLIQKKLYYLSHTRMIHLFKLNFYHQCMEIRYTYLCCIYGFCTFLMQYYSVVDASQGQVFLAVYEDIQYTDLYISDQKGMHYSLSLRNINPRDVNSTNKNVVYDLHKVNNKCNLWPRDRFNSRFFFC